MSRSGDPIEAFVASFRDNLQDILRDECPYYEFCSLRNVLVTYMVDQSIGHVSTTTLPDCTMPCTKADPEKFSDQNTRALYMASGELGQAVDLPPLDNPGSDF